MYGQELHHLTVEIMSQTDQIIVYLYYSPNQYLPSDDRSPLAELSPLADCMKGPARSFPELCPGAGGRFTNSTA